MSYQYTFKSTVDSFVHEHSCRLGNNHSIHFYKNTEKALFTMLIEIIRSKLNVIKLINYDILAQIFIQHKYNLFNLTLKHFIRYC